VLDGLVEIHLDNNNLRDELTTLILMAAFISPTLSSIKLTSNAVKHHAASSLGTMMKLWPEKIKELAITRTPAGGDHLDKCFDSLQKYTGLQVLNLSGTSISIDVCRRIGGCLKSGKRLIRLNLSNCKLAQQGARYVIDGLLENEGLEYLDLSGTALSASSYEFSIKLAKVLTTHMQLVHLNLSETKLQREEVFFLGMMAKHFKVLVGLHLPISELSRYDRVFLRILMNSSVPPLVRRLDHNAQVVASTEEVPDSEGNR
jgi:Ran GTPase-activating protein (RanGAP) involved in mRNA processing and transport